MTNFSTAEISICYAMYFQQLILVHYQVEVRTHICIHTCIAIACVAM